MRVTKKNVQEKLELVLDPEMNISIVDLGLVYKITVKKGNGVHILMTLTTMGCPLFGVIEEDIFLKLSELTIERKNIEIEMTFEPPWDMTRMSKRAKAMMGI
ncbi:DNA methyltransferase [Candidatus Roizmanbacteria bacterium CG17_big_fil_post_rev_8_21_14_2_50_39_7]|uniref:DNA methyltransferase n=2 Tax=Candidatus Roizmaniibacteriota TaxID=1752723 RepID=A0A2M7EK87_9BACT|nr:MAG: DNA methyltransferase [Candidatus Roizmanbacteria bacterium CG03_land_8_20_14_0_80_39_12]PIV70987.1 MAG: DNA methyltransferase [Candidatus Roizmanbacteria bacterium CG17_big_fil_post_rev_8_21_14_2_50_39_7]